MLACTPHDNELQSDHQVPSTSQLALITPDNKFANRNFVRSERTIDHELVVDHDGNEHFQPSYERFESLENLSNLEPELARSLKAIRDIEPYTFIPKTVTGVAFEENRQRAIAWAAEQNPDEEFELIIGLKSSLISPRMPLKDLSSSERRQYMEARGLEIHNASANLRSYIEDVLEGQVISHYRLFAGIAVQVKASSVSALARHDDVRTITISTEGEPNYTGAETRQAIRIDGLIAAGFHGGSDALFTDAYPGVGDQINIGILESTGWLYEDSNGFHRGFNFTPHYYPISGILEHLSCIALSS